MEFIDWINDNLASDIWHKKYQWNNESFVDWLDRVSNGNEDVRQLILDKRFLFGGRILSNRGLQKQGKKVTYSNCYVLDAPKDNLESIFETASKLARTFSYGGGVGIDLGNLRPKGTPVNNTAKETTGAVSFMDLYSMTTGLIGQNGRRGALMISMPIHHPDIEEFIDVKTDLDKVTKANISVRITNEFMRAVILNESYDLWFYDEANDKNIIKTVNARELFMKLCRNNWDYAEPGILYWDEINSNNLLSEYINNCEFEYAGTNPCAEEPLPAGGSCLLGSINLSAHVTKGPNDAWFIDLPLLEDTVRKAVIALDEVLDEGLPLHPLDIQRQTVADWRQIGLGIMGFGDLLYKLEIAYGSEESIEIIDMIGSTIKRIALETSMLLAKEHGPFPKWNTDYVMNSNYLADIADKTLLDDIRKYGLRHSQLLTIAPTGTLSTMLGISGGVEPLFALQFWRKTETLHDEDRYYQVTVPVVQEMLGDWASSTIGTDEQVPLPDYMVTSHDISPIARVKVQGAWQNYIDASISSTVNLKEGATVEDVFDVYMEAWEQGCKGITVYRDNCKRSGILMTSKDDEKTDTVVTELTETEKRGYIVPHTDNSIGLMRRVETGCGTLWVNCFFNRDTHEICDIFLSKGSKGGCQSYMIGLSRMISLVARAGVSNDVILDQLRSVPACPSYITGKRTIPTLSKGTCCPSAVANALEDMINEYALMTFGVREVEEPKPLPKKEVTEKRDEPVSVGCQGGN